MAVERMPHLVGQSKHVVQGILPVEQHIGMGPIGPPGVGSRSLASVFHHIDPMVFQALLEIGYVVFTQGL